MNLRVCEPNCDYSRCFRTLCTVFSTLPGHMIQDEHGWYEQFQKFILQILDGPQKLNILEVKLENCLGTPLEFNECMLVVLRTSVGYCLYTVCHQAYSCQMFQAAFCILSCQSSNVTGTVGHKLYPWYTYRRRNFRMLDQYNIAVWVH